MVERSRAVWYYKVMGSESGPVTARELRNLARAGELARDSLIRKGPSGGWVLAERVGGLFEDLEGSSREVSAASGSTPPTPENTAPNTASQAQDGYALQAPPPVTRRPSAMRQEDSSSSEMQSAVDSGPGEQKEVPQFSISLFGCHIGVQSLVTLGIIIAFVACVCVVLLIVYWPVASQRIAGTKAVSVVKVMSGSQDATLRNLPRGPVYLLRGDSGGEFLFVRVKFSKEFLQEMNGADSKKPVLIPEDFYLVTDGRDDAAVTLLRVEGKAQRMEIPITVQTDDYIDGVLPAVGNVKLKTEAHIEYGRNGIVEKGDVNVAISGALKGSLRATPRYQRPRDWAAGWGITGSVEGELPDNSRIEYQYKSTACAVSWTGDWEAYVPGSSTVSRDQGVFDKTAEVCCLFARPDSASRLEFRYKDAPALDLDASLAGTSGD